MITNLHILLLLVSVWSPEGQVSVRHSRFNSLPLLLIFISAFEDPLLIDPEESLRKSAWRLMRYLAMQADL